MNEGPQLENGYMQISNDVIEDLARAELTGSHIRLVLAVLRKTWGECERNSDQSIKRDEFGSPIKKKQAAISIPQFMDMTNLPRRTIIRSLNQLVKWNVLLKTKGSGRRPDQWAYQKYSSLWEIEQRRLHCINNLHKGATVETANKTSSATVETAIDMPLLRPQINSSATVETANTTVEVPLLRPPINKDLKKGVGENSSSKKDKPKTWDELIIRYSPEEQDIINQYWNIIRQTRATSTLAESVKINWMDKWNQYPVWAVIAGLKIHIERHRDKRENYTNGIIRREYRDNKEETGNNLIPNPNAKRKPGTKNQKTKSCKKSKFDGLYM